MVIDYGKIIFGGVDSSDYGIYISGEGVYNAPERDVELVNVPGRNGAIALDQGRYNNIKVTYPAMVLEADQEHFRERLSEFRNAILSQKGYQRLEDSYHSDEFRMGVYHDGLEVSDILTLARGGNFELIFDCKPQRWMSDGDIPVPVSSGDVLQNPTVFDSSPLLEVEGYGTVSFNGYDIELDNSPLGAVDLVPRRYYSSANVFDNSYKFDRSLLNTGDTINVGQALFAVEWQSISLSTIYSGITYSQSSVSTMTPTVSIVNGGYIFLVRFTTPSLTFTALDVNDSEVEKLANYTISAAKDGGGTDTVYVTVRVKCGYDYIRYRIEVSTSSPISDVDNTLTANPTTGTSTVQLLGNPTYVDCETGEAYRIDDGEYKSSNARVTIGADLPVMSPGSNKVTYDNTITDMKISPRWWKI